MTDVKDILGLSGQQQAGSASSSASSSMASPPAHVFASPSPPLHPRMKRHSTTASPSPSASSLSSPHHPALHRSRSTRPSLGSTSASAASSSSAGKVVAPLAPSRLVIPSTGPAQRWVNVAIRSSARRAGTGLSHDDVDLLHWVKVRGESDYRFSRFNRPIKMRHYTGEQYDAHLIEPNWTRAETDALMALCQQYDLRFIVVADRYNEEMTATSAGRDRTVEELKGRYYGVQCKLLQLQNASDPELRKHPLFTSSYDEEYEKKRKEQLALLYQRRVRDVEEMGQAVLELRKVQNQMKKVKKVAREAREAQRASRGEAGYSSTAGGTVSLSHKKKKHSSSSSASPLLFIPDNQLVAIPDNLLPPAALNTPPQLNAQTPFLRSQQFALSISSLPARVQKAVLADVSGLGVAGVKELVPTAPVWEMWERVRLGVMQWRAMEQLVEEREKVRDELREEERRKGSAGGGGGGGGEIKREKSIGSGVTIGGGSANMAGDDRRKDKKVKKERRDGSVSGDRDDDGSAVGLGGDRGEKVSVSHKKKDRDSKRKGGDGDDRDSKRRKK